MNSGLHMSTREVSGGLGQALKGEAGKFAISVALFVCVFTLVRPINGLTFFGTFIGLQLFYVIVPLLTARRLLNWSGNRTGNRRS